MRAPGKGADSGGALIVNAFSVVAAFAALLRVVLGAVAAVAGVRALRAARRAREEGEGEERFHLLLLLCATLVGLSVVSWPLLYVVLESYVPSNGGPPWPGVMCVQGVTRVGTGSVGAASYLPALLNVLAVTKPLLVLVSGAWVAMHVVNRRSRTGALATRTTAALALCGLLAVADGATETAYLLIPKEEKFLAAGCCAVETPRSQVAATPVPKGPVTAAFLGVGVGAVLAISAAIRRGGAWLGVSLLLAAASLLAGGRFLVDVASPGFLHLPYHHCPYCLVRRMPETLVGIVLHVAGAFGVGWALITPSADARKGLLRMARFGYLGALVMATVMLLDA